MARALAPTALRTPISRVRSRTATSMMFITPMPPRKSVTTPTAPMKYFIPSVIIRKALAFSIVSQMDAASSSRGSNLWMRASARRSSHLQASWYSSDFGTAISRSIALGGLGGLLGKSRRTELKGMKTLEMSWPS